MSGHGSQEVAPGNNGVPVRHGSCNWYTRLRLQYDSLNDGHSLHCCCLYAFYANIVFNELYYIAIRKSFTIGINAGFKDSKTGRKIHKYDPTLYVVIMTVYH